MLVMTAMTFSSEIYDDQCGGDNQRELVRVEWGGNLKKTNFQRRKTQMPSLSLCAELIRSLDLFTRLIKSERSLIENRVSQRNDLRLVRLDRSSSLEQEGEEEDEARFTRDDRFNYLYIQLLVRTR